ncbi:hypothetical protein AB0E83_18440, partial [Streptomyces sp. NPDC035033]|uniref:hypothetical protein n=1 Tax=Streptomyces sp. NPDC035033 TaxID=3155368 RepID=UPI0033F5AB42
ALIFGTLLSSQGADASFGPDFRGPSGRFLRFQPYQILFRSVSGSDFVSGGLLAAFAFRRVHYFSRFPGRLIIEPFETNFGMPK